MSQLINVTAAPALGRTLVRSHHHEKVWRIQGEDHVLGHPKPGGFTRTRKAADRMSPNQAAPARVSSPGAALLRTLKIDIVDGAPYG